MSCFHRDNSWGLVGGYGERQGCVEGWTRKTMDEVKKKDRGEKEGQIV